MLHPECQLGALIQTTIFQLCSYSDYGCDYCSVVDYVFSCYVYQCVDFLSAISFGELIALNKIPSHGCSRLLLVSQLSRMKDCELGALLKDTTYCSSHGSNHRSLYPETDILTA